MIIKFKIFEQSSYSLKRVFEKQINKSDIIKKACKDNNITYHDVKVAKLKNSDFYGLPYSMSIQNKKQETPEINDYVLLNVVPGSGIDKKLENKIGKVINIINDVIIHVEFDSDDFELLHKSWIEFKSKNKEDVELYLDTKNYNL